MGKSVVPTPAGLWRRQTQSATSRACCVNAPASGSSGASPSALEEPCGSNGGQGGLEAIVVAREEDGGSGTEYLAQVACRALKELALGVGDAELPADRVEARRSALVVARGVGLIVDALAQVADDERDDHHDDERHEVTEIGDGEAEVRREKEELEGEGAQHGREERRSVAEPHRHDDDAEQEHHHDVGQLGLAKYEPGDERRRSGYRQSCEIPEGRPRR